MMDPPSSTEVGPFKYTNLPSRCYRESGASFDEQNSDIVVDFDNLSGLKQFEEPVSVFDINGLAKIIVRVFFDCYIQRFKIPNKKSGLDSRI